MKIWRTVLSLGRDLVLGFARSLVALAHLLRNTFLVTTDIRRGRQSLEQGELVCPRGHRFPVAGGVYHCEGCGFVYEGSALRCANPECGATTPYINCHCGLSVRNPYRWGRPR